MLMNVQDIARDRAAPSSATMLISPAATVAQSSPRRTDTVGSIISAEVLAGFRAWPVWVILGWDDIRQRYRRSALGPFWITLSMGIFISLLGVIYSRLFHTDIRTYIPFISAGFTVWGFISTVTIESCMAFNEGSRIIKQIKLPYSIYVLRVVWRNVIVFLHTVVIFIPVAIIFKVTPNLATLYVLPGLFLVCVNVTWVAAVLAVLSTRYRDMPPIVATGVQIMMFATPIMWPVRSLLAPPSLPRSIRSTTCSKWCAHRCSARLRELRSWLVAGSMAIVGSMLATALLVRKSRRIVFWL